MKPQGWRNVRLDARRRPTKFGPRARGKEPGILADHPRSQSDHRRVFGKKPLPARFYLGHVRCPDVRAVANKMKQLDLCSSPEKLVRVVSPYFVAGFVIHDGRVIDAAPILRKHVIGKTEDEAREIIYGRGWKATIVR
jgi:hypothetical protein